MASSNLAGTLRRSLLIKVISKPAPSREDVTSVIELTASKVVEALQAQSMTFYLVEGNEIAFKQVYYSPTLWTGDPVKEKKFQETAGKLLSLKIPLGKGIVGKVIESGEPLFFRNSESQAPFMQSMAQTTGFEVRSMLTVPLKTTITLGAIQVLNKELSAGTDGDFTDKDLALLKEVAEYSIELVQRLPVPQQLTFLFSFGRLRDLLCHADEPHESTVRDLVKQQVISPQSSASVGFASDAGRVISSRTRSPSKLNHVTFSVFAL